MLARCKKKIALTALVAGCFHAGNLLAVGLGEMTVNSSLNEPLDATIQVVGLDGLNEGQLSVSLGSQEDFERANIPRVGLIDDIELEIDVFNSEEGILRLTSDELVQEPFLNMVISMRWPNGRLMRDYTALIDLPVFISDEPTAAPVDVSETPEPEPAPVVEEPRSQILVDNEQPAAVTPAPSTPDPAPETTTADGDNEVTVEAGDNLFNIASENRPSDSVSVEQTMLAIQRANPDSFIDGNINRVRVGSILRIPTLQEVQSIDQSQAVNEIALQNQASSAQPLAFNSNTGSGNEDTGDELTILSGDAGDTPTGDSDLASTIAALENQLALSEENLDRARLENQELRARFAELEEQIEILQNIIAMQDVRLAQLQADLAANQAEPEPEPAPEQAPVAAQPAPAQPAPQDTSIIGQLSSMFENTLVLVSSLVALIVLVLGFLVWSRRAAQDEMDDFALEGASAAPASQATYTEDEPVGASAGFIAALKARFSRDDEDDDVAIAADDSQESDATEDSDATEPVTAADSVEDDEDEGGFLGKLKNLFSRSDDDDDFEVADAADDESDDEDDDADIEATSAFAMDDDADDDEDDEDEDEEDDDEDSDEGIADEVSDDSSAQAEEEFDFDFDEDDDADDNSGDDSDDDSGEDAEEDDFDLDNLGDMSLDDDDDSDASAEETAVEDVAETEADEDEVPETFDFDLGETNDSDDDTKEVTASAEEPEEVESFDFSLDDTPAAPAEDEAAAATDVDDEEVESFDFNLSDTPETAEAEDSTAEEPEDVETFEFDVGSVSSFEEPEADEAEEAPAEDVETFDFDLDSSADTAEPAPSAADDSSDDGDVDPLAAALDEVDAEADDGAGADDDLDLGSIEIDDSMFDADDDNAAAGGERDEASTKLDLAVAYEAMGDMDGAKEILDEVVAEGNDEQVAEAKKLLEKWNLS